MIKDQLRAGARVNAAHDTGEGKLVVTGLFHLLHLIAMQRATSNETSIAALQALLGLRRGGSGLLALGQGLGIRRQAAATEADEQEGGEQNVRGGHGLPL